MKNALIAIMFALALGCAARPTVAQNATPEPRNASQDRVVQSNDVIAATQSVEPMGKWKEPTSTIVTVTSSPLERGSARKKQWSDPSGNRPSKEDWTRCLQNEKCVSRNLYNNKWDRMFGPAYDFGN